MKVSVVIPVYNAADIVEDSVMKLVRRLDALGPDYEIILRDDGSRDGSARVMRGVSERYSQVRCFYGIENRGLGATLSSLFSESGGDLVIYSDCDLPFGTDIFSAILKELEHYDIVVASRYKGRSSPVRLARWFFSRAYYLFCQWLFAIRVADIGSGTVGIRRTALHKLNLNRQGFGIHAELYTKAGKEGLSIFEMPAACERGKTGSFSIFRHGFKTLLETLTLYKEGI